MNIEKIYPKCRSILNDDLWISLSKQYNLDDNPEIFPDILKTADTKFQIPDYLRDFAQIELSLYRMRLKPLVKKNLTSLTINPTLDILEVKWKNLSFIFSNKPEHNVIQPEQGEEMLLLWRAPDTDEEYIEEAASEDLLVLKMIIEDIPAEAIALSGKVPIGAVDEAVDRAIEKGLLLAPETLIKRDPDFVSDKLDLNNQPMQVHFFTLQWHVTQACDLKCKHCYDRSDRSTLTLDQGLRILDDLRDFCHKKNVRCQITFSGGNPLLYPYFNDLYRAASEKGFILSILGNPAPKSRIEELIASAPLSFYQVSLEGLQEHNDYIRGSGHFERSITFLEVLKELNIYSMVMLTLTKNNMDQVIPLGEKLRNLTDQFTFNRLSQVGEGANLNIPTRDEYRVFLKEYLEAADKNPVMGLKDNLINILCHEQGIKTTGGCTGFGCGAAFNFLTLLPDGEVHACRKFPSFLGNIFDDSLADIYDSELAGQYRSGSASCNSCPIKPSCGGCLANVFSHGLDIYKDRDPHCFM